MSSESETNDLQNNGDTIEEKRRKNVIDNQKFLKNLKLINARNDLKSTVKSLTKPEKTKPKKPKQNKSNRKEKFKQAEIRRSSRIQSMPHAIYTTESTHDDDIFIVSSNDETSDEKDDLRSAFTSKIDKDWQPSHPPKTSHIKTKPSPRKTTKPIFDGVKIYLPNIGLQASKVLSKEKLCKSHVSKKTNIAISSSSEEEEDN